MPRVRVGNYRAWEVWVTKKKVQKKAGAIPLKRRGEGGETTIDWGRGWMGKKHAQNVTVVGLPFHEGRGNPTVRGKRRRTSREQRAHEYQEG